MVYKKTLRERKGEGLKKKKKKKKLKRKCKVSKQYIYIESLIKIRWDK
jgi:hypothetical protein